MLAEKLQKFFAFSEFRAGQQEIVESILAGQDTLALMPTGAGKSLCFQLPAVMFPHLTIVISPLIALMKNQVDSLTARGIRATFLNSSLSWEEQQARLTDLAQKKYTLLYLAPERLANVEFAHWLIQQPISFIAIDEAHCISSWGHDFRPEYQQIATFIKSLPQRPVIAAFTATATQEVARDIQNRLDLHDPAVFVRGFDRPNLRLFVRAKVTLQERKKEALRLLTSITGSGIIYTLTIKEAEEINTFLCANGIKSAVYHAKIEAEKRSKIQDDFMENRYQVVVATIAFGMGIDKADIRYVIHIGMPPTMERYYQEAGRAGRDGELSYCILLQNGRDKATQHYFIQQSKTQMINQGKTAQEIYTLTNLKYEQLAAMQNYVDTTGCRRKILLEYFQDPQAQGMQKCQGCDNCLHFRWKKTLPRTKKTKSYAAKDPSELSGTILETVKLYQSHHSPDQIAQIRSLGHTTIMNHLAEWYASGGDFDLSAFVSPAIEKQIQAVISKWGADKLSPLKAALPASISYDQIRLVVAKVARAKGTL